MISKEKHQVFDRSISKWQEVLGIRGALFALRKGKSVLQVQFDSFLIEQMEDSILYDAFSNFHFELMSVLKDEDIEVEYVKISGFDVASEMFWVLAAQGLETK